MKRMNRKTDNWPFQTTILPNVLPKTFLQIILVAILVQLLCSIQTRPPTNSDDLCTSFCENLILWLGLRVGRARNSLVQGCIAVVSPRRYITIGWVNIALFILFYAFAGIPLYLLKPQTICKCLN